MTETEAAFHWDIRRPTTGAQRNAFGRLVGHPPAEKHRARKLRCVVGASINFKQHGRDECFGRWGRWHTRKPSVSVPLRNLSVVRGLPVSSWFATRKLPMECTHRLTVMLTKVSLTVSSMLNVAWHMQGWQGTGQLSDQPLISDDILQHEPLMSPITSHILSRLAVS